MSSQDFARDRAGKPPIRSPNAPNPDQIDVLDHPLKYGVVWSDQAHELAQTGYVFESPQGAETAGHKGLEWFRTPAQLARSELDAEVGTQVDWTWNGADLPTGFWVDTEDEIYLKWHPQETVMGSVLDDAKLLDQVQRNMNFMIREAFPKIVVIDPPEPPTMDVYKEPKDAVLFHQYHRFRVDRDTNFDSLRGPDVEEFTKAWLLGSSCEALLNRMRPFVADSELYVFTKAQLFVRRHAWQLMATWWVDVYRKEQTNGQPVAA